MIKFALKCSEGHTFDSWFGSGADYDRLKAAGHVSCIVCGSQDVEKSVMAPRIATPAAPEERPATGELSAPASPAEQMLRALRKEVESNCENVGKAFPDEARAIHNGEAPVRGIIGQAKPDEARALIEDGVPIVPLPWSSGKKN